MEEGIEEYFVLKLTPGEELMYMTREKAIEIAKKASERKPDHTIVVGLLIDSLTRGA